MQIALYLPIAYGGMVEALREYGWFVTSGLLGGPREGLVARRVILAYCEPCARQLMGDDMIDTANRMFEQQDILRHGAEDDAEDDAAAESAKAAN